MEFLEKSMPKNMFPKLKEKVNRNYEDISISSSDILKHLKLEDIRMLCRLIKRNLMSGTQQSYTLPIHLFIVIVEDISEYARI